MDLINYQTLYDLNDKFKKKLTILIVIGVIQIIICVILSLMCTYQSNKWAIIIDSIMASIFVSYLIFTLKEVIIPMSNLKRLLNTLFKKQPINEIGILKDIGEKFTIRNGLQVYPLSFEGLNRKYYFINIDNIEDSIGKSFNLSSIDGFVLHYEVTSNE